MDQRPRRGDERVKCPRGRRVHPAAWRVVGLLAGVLLGLFAVAAPVAAATIEVTSVGDPNPPVNGDGCTLREAIQAANTNAPVNDCVGGDSTLDTITFNIGPLDGSVKTITVTAALGGLPIITNAGGPVLIDGYTQDPAHSKANTLLVGSDAVLLIELSGASAPTVNGLIVGADNSEVRGLIVNRFSGVGHAGIQVTGASVTVDGCIVGTNAAGATGIGNDIGIQVSNAANAVIGGTTPAARNVASGNSSGNGMGIQIGNLSTNAKVQGNYAGTNPAGTSAVPNQYGVRIDNAVGTIVGGTSAAERNVLSGNTASNGTGLFINGGGVVTNTITQGNYIGVGADGTTALSNSIAIWLNAAPNTTIGGTASGAGNVVSGNTIGNGLGIFVANVSTGATIVGNRIGTNPAGTAAIPNQYGIYVDHVANVTVGGTTPGAPNLISGNTSGIGILLIGATASGAVIQGNFIGTNVSGTAAIGNTVGIYAQGANLKVGGTSAAARNIISGNTAGNGYGIWLDGNTASNATIQGNYIGTNVDGTASIANNVGIEVTNAPNVTIGGTASGARNVISGNSVGPASIGVHINGTGSTGAQIQGNYIGTNAAGNGSIPNRFGVRIENAPGATIGGTSAVTRNVISGNTASTGVGILIVGAAATNTIIQGNYIGVAADGNTAAPNTIGIASDPSSITIGGTGAGEANIIAQNSDLGVDVVSGTRITIRGNSIYSNGGLGIDLGEDGLTANDTGDGDTGANNLQNFPILTSAVVDTSGARVSGTLNSTANTTFTIDLYANAGCDPSGNGEGKTYLTTTSLSTNGSGDGSFSLVGVSGVTAGNAITATATDPSGNTSEFSACQTAASPAVVVSPTAVAVAEGGAGSSFSVRLNGVPTSTVTVTLAYDANQLTVAPSTLTFQPDGSALAAQIVTVGAVDDTLAEGTQTSTISLSSSSSDTPFNNASIPSVTATITDNEAGAGLSVADASVAEANGATSTVTFTVTLAPPSASTVTVQYATANGTATGGASCGTAGVDYLATSGTLTFATGETSKAIPVTVCGDTLAEGSETFTLALSNAANSTIARATATGTILDDDAGGTVQLSAAAYSVGENDGAVTVTVQRVTGVASSVTVQYVTADGTAKAGLDYTAVSGTLTFAAGESVKTISIPILADAIDEPSETFSIMLSNPTGGAALGAPATATVTIADVDTTPCRTVLSAEVPIGSTTLPVVSQAGCAIGDHVAINPGGSTEERDIITGFGSIIIDQPTTYVHHVGEVVVKIGIQEDLGRYVAPPEDDTDKPRKLTDEERQQRQRTNRAGQDDYRTEGNVVEVRCDAPIPTVVIANRDGNVEVRLLKDAATACGSIQVGDYLEAEGEKQNEQLYEVTDVSVTRHR